MSGEAGPWARVVGAFVAPAERAEAAAPVAIAVLCRAEDAWAVGGAVALALGGAVVVAWGEEVSAPLVRAPAGRAMSRLAATLAQRGHDAKATGRIVQVRADAPGEAARVAAAADVPCVAVLAGPRDDGVDALLRAHDHVLVEADDAIADLVVTSLATIDIPARRLTVTGAPAAAKALAAAGVALVPALRARVAEGLR